MYVMPPRDDHSSVEAGGPLDSFGQVCDQEKITRQIGGPLMNLHDQEKITPQSGGRRFLGTDGAEWILDLPFNYSTSWAAEL